MPRHQNPSPRHRVAILQLLLVAWAALVVARLFYLQVSRHHWLSDRALHQQEETLAVEAHRGTIFDRHKTPLAMSLPVDSIFATPHAITDPDAEASALASVLHLAPPARARLARDLAAHHSFAWVKRQVTADEAAAVEALHLPGIYSQPDTRRFYPKGNLAAALLGFVGVDGHGLAGIEHSYDALLSGRDGRAVIEVDARRDSYSQIEVPPEEGANLVLTLDQNIQFIAQQELDAQVAATHALRGMVVVQNPKTGAILALANSPSFLPDNYRHTPPMRLGDPVVSLAYEPGSVFKLVTISAALQQGLITPDEIINCLEGRIRVGGRIIHDHARFGLITVTEVLQHSSDVGAIQIGLKMGDDTFYKYIRAYGFGQRTGIGLPGESPGIVRPPNRWTPMSIGAVSMGQEVAVTPLQEVAMISTLADGGVYHAPRIVLSSFHGDEAPDHAPVFHPAAGRRVVSPLVANEMKQMMAEVVLAGTGRHAQLNGYTSGGKTGTAQKADPNGHGYSKTDYIASFGGITPLNDPALTILVVIDSPRGGHEGGDVSAPVFKRIAERVLPYLGVPHDVPVKADAAEPRLAGIDQKEESQPLGLPPEALSTAGAPIPEAALASAAKPPADGPAPAVGANPNATAPSGSTSGSKASLIVLHYGTTAAQAITTPDFTGQSVRTVSETCERLGLQVDLEGNGTARSQFPAPGTPLQPGARVKVQFAP